MTKHEQQPNTTNQNENEGFPTQLVLLLVVIGCILLAFGLKIIGVF